MQLFSLAGSISGLFWRSFDPDCLGFARISIIGVRRSGRRLHPLNFDFSWCRGSLSLTGLNCLTGLAALS